MTTKNAILIGCGVVAGLGLILLVVVIFLVAHMAQDVEGISVNVQGPTDVAMGETFGLKVVVTNERAGKSLEVSSIDIAEEYLAGFSVISMDPEPASSTHIPIDESRSFAFNADIPAGESRTFLFNLRAEKAGLYRGDVDTCEGMRFISTMAQTSVKEK